MFVYLFLKASKTLKRRAPNTWLPGAMQSVTLLRELFIIRILYMEKLKQD